MKLIKFIILFLLIVFSTSLFAEQQLNFDAIKSKMIDVDVNLTIPVNIISYKENNSFTFITPVFPNLVSQTVTTDVYYIDSNGNKIQATIDKDEFGNNIATFYVNPITQSRYNFNINAHIISQNKLILPNKKYDLNNPITDYNEFLVPTKNIQSNRSEIITLANSIKTGNDAITEILGITNWVHQNITYDTKYADTVEDSVTVLSNRSGVCDEFANLTAALLRARGIPTRYISGYANSTLSWEAHAWVEAYVPGYGWISIDPTYGEVGQVDASHIIGSIAKDPDDIKDKLTTINTVNIEFLDKEKAFNINSQKSYADYGYSSVLNINLTSPSTMKENSAFTIKANIKNTNANPIITLIILRTHDSFTQIYPKYSEQIIYLDPFQDKELIYNFILPSLEDPMSFSYMLANQYKDVSGKVDIYLNDGLYQEVFLVNPPSIYFKDNKLDLSIDITNHTSKQKEIKLDYNYCGVLSSESKIIPKLSNDFITYTKEFDKQDNCRLDFVISGDYTYSKSIYIYPTQEIKVIDNQVNNLEETINTDKNIDENKTSDIWKDINNQKIVGKTNNKSYVGYILFSIFILIILLIIFIKPKRKIGNLTHV